MYMREIVIFFFSCFQGNMAKQKAIFPPKRKQNASAVSSLSRMDSGLARMKLQKGKIVTTAENSTRKSSSRRRFLQQQHQDRKPLLHSHDHFDMNG
jgi:hypothetical protein